MTGMWGSMRVAESCMQGCVGFCSVCVDGKRLRGEGWEWEVGGRR